MFQVSSPAFDLSAALVAAQSRLATTSVGTGARSEDVLASSSFGGAASTSAPTTYFDGSGTAQPTVGFSTPSSTGRDSGVLGESFAAGGVTSDLGVFSVFIMTSQMASDLCCGEVAGLKFCTAGRQVCSIRKHSKKVKVLIGHIYVSGPRNSAFTQIYLNPSLVSPSLVSRILGERSSLDAWQRLFGAISQASSELSEGQFESLKLRVLTGTTLGLTPRKGIQRYEDDRASSEHQSSKLSPIGQYKDDELDMESLLAAQLDKFSTFSKGTAESLDLLRQAVGEEIDQLEVGLQNLTLKVGVDPGLNDTPMLSAWEGIEYLNALFLKSKQGQMNFQQIIANHAQWIVQNEPKINSSAFTTQAVGVLQNQMNQVLQLVTVLSQENQILSTQVQALRNNSGNVSPATSSMHMGLYTPEIENIRDLIRRMDARLASAEARLSGQQGTQSVNQLNTLQARFDILEARVSSKPAYVCGRTFLSLPDMMTWVVTNLPNNVYYLFHDVVSLLEHVDPITVHRQDIIIEQFQSSRVGYSTDAESRMVTSFKITLPQVFCGDKKETSPGTGGRHFPGCKSYANWNLHDGTNVNRTIKFDISNLLHDHHEARSLANDLHGLSVSFVGEYLNWIDNFYLELMQISGCTSDEAWEVTGKCGKQVFEIFREIRNIAGNANMETDSNRKAARYLYAIVSCHQEMQRFLDKGFRNHESIFPIINLHLFQASASRTTLEQFISSINKDVKRIEARCNQIDTLQGKLQKLTSTTDSLSGKRSGKPPVAQGGAGPPGSS
jgi:hypothetical protein